MALIKLLVAPIRRMVNFPLFQLMAAIAVILLRAAISSLPLKMGGMGRGSRPPRRRPGARARRRVCLHDRNSRTRRGRAGREIALRAFRRPRARRARSRGPVGARAGARLAAHGGRGPGLRSGNRGGALGSLLLPLSGHSGHGRARCWLDPVANDPTETLVLTQDSRSMMAACLEVL